MCLKKKNKYFSPVNDGTSQEPEADTTHIIVYNVPAEADEEYLEMFFEKYGDGPVNDIDIDREQEIAVIEFEELECECYFTIRLL